MKLILSGARALHPALTGSVVTLGTFDGVHLGHRALVEAAQQAAARFDVPLVAYTFDPHPAKILAPDRAPKVLTPIEERARLLGALGVDLVLVEPFDEELAQVGADSWVERYLVEPLRPKRVVVGFNFSYGRGREGNPDTLRALGARLDFEVEIVDAVTVDGQIVSSTRVRGLLGAGEIGEANRLLGHPFATLGTVVEGDRRGRTIGFPTANLKLASEVVPHPGVYAAWVELPDGQLKKGVTNVGYRPTFGGRDLRVEVHILDYSGDLYGEQLRVSWAAHIRGEETFSGPAALIEQIGKDIEVALECLL